MKNILLILLFCLFSCEHEDDSNITIRSDYNGEYYIFVQNADGEENAVFIKGTSGNYEVTNDKLVDTVGEPVYLKVAAIKVTGDLYPDEGNLEIGIYDNDDLVISDVAGMGDIEADLEYQL